MKISNFGEWAIASVLAAACSVVAIGVVHAGTDAMHRAICASNLRAIGVQIGQYAEDNDGMMPHDFSKLPAGITKLNCPQAPRWQSFAYAYNGNLMHDLMGTFDPHKPGSWPLMPKSRVVYPATTVEVSDAVFADVWHSPEHYAKDKSPHADNSLQNHWSLGPDESPTAHGHSRADVVGYADKRHDGGANYLFVDGHVQWYVPAAVAAAPSSADKNDGVHPTFAVNTK